MSLQSFAASRSGRGQLVNVQRRLDARWCSSRFTALRAEPLIDADGIVYARFQGGSVVEAAGPAPAGSEPIDGDESSAPEVWYIGEIKSYAPQQGYGFIECADTFQVYKNDVFLHKNQVVGGPMKKAMKGEAVRFSVDLNKKGRPQARNVDRYVADSPWVTPTKNFVGRVKRYSQEQGFGFISCEDTFNVFSSDVFLHKNQFESAGLELGNLVTFTVEVNEKGKAQARNVARFTPNSFQGGEVQLDGSDPASPSGSAPAQTQDR